MQPVPNDIPARFNAVMEQNPVSLTLRDDYRKRFRCYHAEKDALPE